MWQTSLLLIEGLQLLVLQREWDAWGYERDHIWEELCVENLLLSSGHCVDLLVEASELVP